MNYSLVILAGGEGSRLKSISNNQPKILTEVAGKLFFEWLCENIIRLGFKNVFYITNEDLDLRPYFKEFKEDLNQTLLHDGKQRLGTGGAIVNNLDSLPEKFWIMYGDTLLNWNHKESEKIFNSKNLNVLMTIINSNIVNEKPNVKITDDRVTQYSKESDGKFMYVDYGALLVKKSIFKIFPRDINIDLKEILKFQIDKQDCGFHEVDKQFYEIGNPISFNKTKSLLSNIPNLEELWN